MNSFITVLEHINYKKNALTIACLCLLLTVSLSTNSLTLFSQAIDSTSTSQVVTLTNNGTANLVLGA